ncbi:MAG: Catalase domain protein [Hydrocarboniphaga sp.]|uniref:catalase family peroxidase n=1 Tax=Hydrocarboniphaga sp. TaxID=2033016 RepID=UPI002602FCCA|nr:catalase family peroxidase [Hydrocarboniphaga sp.]MDB5971237.1 Catalase domain protein [Hydrocarboniphaga sp.]
MPPSTPRSASPAPVLLKLAIIALVLLIFASAFGYAGGWLGSRGLTGSAMVDALQANADPHPGFRRNHAKGICVSGYFEGNGDGARLSSAEFFTATRAQVVGRLALAGGDPYVADDSVPVRSLALQLRLPDGQEWRTGMNDIPGFPVSTPQAFQELTEASHPDPQTGKPRPDAMKAFQARYPEAAAFGERLKASPRSSSFANDTYNGINAFVFVAADHRRHRVRWSMEPELPFAPRTAAAAEPAARDALFDDLLTRLDQGPLHWHLIVTVAAAGDASDRAAEPWPADRERIDVGRLTLTGASSEPQGSCRDIVYDPLVLPSGIEASDDPLLSARSSAYAVSYRRRAGEPPGDSAINDRKAGSAP